MKTCIYNGILMDGIHKTQPGVLIIEDGRIQSIKINTKSLPSCDVMLDAKGHIFVRDLLIPILMASAVMILIIWKGCL